MSEEPALKRKRAPHTETPSHLVLNALPITEAKRIYEGLAARATKEGSCLFPPIQLRINDYPRYTLNKTDISMLHPDMGSILSNKTAKTRVPYHHIAWRASGQMVPDFESGDDLSHKCRRGQMRKPGSKGSFSCSEEKKGCFSIECLELTTHTSNLDRGKCKPITECPNCELVFKSCNHEPICGTELELEAALTNQKVVKRIKIEFTDGTSSIIEHEDN